MVDYFKKIKIKDGIVVFDRGITSENNILELKENKWDSICGIKSTNKLKDLLLGINENKLMTFQNRVKTKKSIFYVQEVFYSIGSINGKLLICYNEKKAKDLKESRYDEIEYAKKMIKANKKIKKGMSKFIWTNGSIKLDNVIKQEKLDGFSFIFSSSKKLKKEDIVRLYFTDKDLVEKAFQCIKGVAGLRPIRHWLFDRVKAHIFICYLSFVLLSYLKIKLVKKYFTIDEALEELETAYKVYLKDTKKGISISKLVCLTKKQEEILKSIDKNLVKLPL